MVAGNGEGESVSQLGMFLCRVKKRCFFFGRDGWVLLAQRFEIDHEPFENLAHAAALGSVTLSFAKYGRVISFG